MITVRIEGQGKLVADLTEYQGKVDTAMIRAMNRGILAARTYMVKETGKDTGLKAADIKKAFTMRKAKRSSLVAILGAGLKRLPLIAFGASGPEPSRGKGRGVTYRLLEGKRQRIQNAFIATMPTGHRGVFVRPGKTRLKIIEQKGVSLGHVFDKYRQAGLARAAEVFESTFGHELVYAQVNGSTDVPETDE